MIETEKLVFEVNDCRGLVEGWKLDLYLGPAPYTVEISEETGLATVCNDDADPTCDTFNVCHLDKRQENEGNYAALNWYGAWFF